MLIVFFSSYSSFFPAPPLVTPPFSPSPSSHPQKLKFCKKSRKWAHIIKGQIVILERTSFDVNREVGKGGVGERGETIDQ